LSLPALDNLGKFDVKTTLFEHRGLLEMPKPAPAEHAPAATLTDHIAVRIVRVSEALARIATRRIEARWGLKNTDLRVLNVLDGSPPLPVAEVSRRTHVDKAWISRTLKSLHDRGLVDRAADRWDARLALVSLTPKGQALLEEVRPHALQHEAALLQGVDGARFKAMLDRLEANAERILEGG
jgi:DNA-binding MarR family transcriptional regulator